MERELILPVKDAEITTEFIEAEKRNMLKLFPFIESFQAFVTSNEVFHLKKHKWITKASRLLQAYYTLTPDPSYVVFCKN
ncbi:MAG: hypothetical protein ACTHJ5_08610 [Ilyomonas sp.]